MLRAVLRAFLVGCVLVSVGRADAGESSAATDYSLLFDYSFTEQQLREVEQFAATEDTSVALASLSIAFDANGLWADDDLAFQTSDGTTFQLAVVDENTWSLSIGQSLGSPVRDQVETNYVDSGDWIEQQYGDLDATLDF